MSRRPPSLEARINATVDEAVTELLDSWHNGNVGWVMDELDGMNKYLAMTIMLRIRSELSPEGQAQLDRCIHRRIEV
jgi:hypothetical protein